MNIKNKITTLLFALTTSFYGQDVSNVQDSIVKKETKLSYLDSIKSTFVNDQLATCIDSLWMKELTTLDLYDEMITDIKNVNVDQKVDFELPTELLKERLKKLDEKSPFNIEYNIGLENVIKSFLKNRKRAFERLLGISQYYFPLFEDELAKNNIPLEIKYLAVIESALNPRAVSRVGATGLWQFMYQTGKQYGLNIDSYTDDRIEPLKASQAASVYMNNMYKIFGDWDLVLAAYNSGPGNVAKAIRRSGGQQNYWNIRKNLPKETQGYLPAFLATMYIFEYHKEHGIVPNKAVANLYNTDTIGVKKHITFKQIGDLLDIPVTEIQFFNPSYKRNEIPHITGETKYLRLPKDKIAVFTSNEDKIYAYVEHEEHKRERPFERIEVEKNKDSSAVASIETKEFTTKTKFYKVRKGDNLNEIANQFNVSVSELKKWNNLKSNKAPRGKKLKIYTYERVVSAPASDNNSSKQPIASKEKLKTEVSEKPEDKKIVQTEKVVANKETTKFHKVKKGDNLKGIASKYGVSVSELKQWNKLKGDKVNLGVKLKIIKTEKVTTLVKKEVKQALVKSKEEVAVEENKQPKTEKKEEKIDSNSKIDNYYEVAKGDNLFSIAKKYNVTVANLIEWNNITDNTVKVGNKLLVGKGEIKNVNENNTSKNSYAVKTKKAKETIYQVRKGDTLVKITQKFPGITITYIKKCNNIKGESLKPGMKLKING